MVESGVEGVVEVEVFVWVFVVSRDGGRMVVGGATASSFSCLLFFLFFLFDFFCFWWSFFLFCC